eukprot:m.91124 g.91124  ORF g.91124 m.91124 type:complete len:286 (+) comp8864_c0_seq2:46-903(+)
MSLHVKNGVLSMNKWVSFCFFGHFVSSMEMDRKKPKYGVNGGRDGGVAEGTNVVGAMVGEALDADDVELGVDGVGLDRDGILCESSEVGKKVNQDDCCQELKDEQDFQSEEEKWMKYALKEAELALLEGEVPVGCVIICNGDIIGRGHNETNKDHNATRHAELVAFDDCVGRLGGNVTKAKELMKIARLYVSVEPCVMCAHALRLLGLVDVVFGCQNERFGGCGSTLNVALCNTADELEKLRIVSGPGRVSAINLLKLFYVNENPNAPQPKRKTRRELKLVEHTT